jgi:hypothetical protein
MVPIVPTVVSRGGCDRCGSPWGSWKEDGDAAVVRGSDEAVPCRENSNVNVVVRSTLRLRRLLGNWRLRWPPSPFFSPSSPLYFSRLWREVVTTRVVAERREG